VGVYISTTGWYRERGFEGFSIIAWIRTIGISLFFGAISDIVHIFSYIIFLPLAVLLVACFVAACERLVSEFYKTYIKAEYKPHAVCEICHRNVHKVNNRYVKYIRGKKFG